MEGVEGSSAPWRGWKKPATEAFYICILETSSKSNYNIPGKFHYSHSRACNGCIDDTIIILKSQTTCK